MAAGGEEPNLFDGGRRGLRRGDIFVEEQEIIELMDIWGEKNILLVSGRANKLRKCDKISSQFYVYFGSCA